MRRFKRWSGFVLAMALALATASAAFAGAIRSIEDFPTKEKDLPFSDARNRVAMFTFEDPDHTQLGDAIAFLVSKRVLFDAGVESLAIILFEQGLKPDESGLSYFEKVDKITSGRGFAAALWGHIAREGDELVVDTFVQLYPRNVDRLFDRHFQVAEFDQSLRASVAPKRIWVQSLRFKLSQAESIRTIAESVRTLRKKPRLDSKRVDDGYLSEGATYRVLKRRGSWTQLFLVETGKVGWTSVDVYCGGETLCASIIGGAEFLIDLLRYANGLRNDVRAFDIYTRPARAVSAQIEVLKLLRAGRESAVSLEAAEELMSDWIMGDNNAGDVTFANLWTLASLYRLQRTDDLNPESIRSVANQLARAVLNDPGNLDMLHNLAVLFRFLGDEDKSRLAERLYEEQLARIAH